METSGGNVWIVGLSNDAVPSAGGQIQHIFTTTGSLITITTVGSIASIPLTTGDQRRLLAAPKRLLHDNLRDGASSGSQEEAEDRNLGGSVGGQVVERFHQSPFQLMIPQGNHRL